MANVNHLITTDNDTIYRVVITELPSNNSWADHKYQVGEVRVLETIQGAKSFLSYLRSHDVGARLEMGTIDWSLVIA